VTDNDWANAGIGLVTVPAQVVTWVADVTIFNSWAFWTDALISDPGAFPTKAAEVPAK
jgi:hypothetical protein